ncbi:MAG: FKBP-type peptidyl-prolyl cis-trans isomerase [Gemmatimonadaceae bacterium]
MILTKRILPILALAVFPLVTSGCFSSDSTGVKSATVEETTFASSLGVNIAASTRTTNGAYVRDVIVGPGAVVAAGQSLGVKYSGYLANGTLFDSNTSASTLLTFRLGAGQLIAGFDEGVPGMRVGGTRQILIPPALGYGANGNGPIPGNSVLVFTVQVVSAQ